MTATALAVGADRDADVDRDGSARVAPDLRLFPGMITAWLLTWWATGVHGRAVLAAAALAAVLLAIVVVIVIAFSAKGLRAPVGLTSVLLVLALAAAVLTVTGLRLRHREQDPLAVAAGGHLVATFAGSVAGDPSRLRTPSASGAERFAVRISVHELTVRGRTVRSAVPMVVFGGPSWGSVVAGSHLRGTGRLQPAELGQAEAAVAFPRGSPEVIDSGGWVWRVAEQLRVGLRQACRGLPADARGLLPALVVGDTSRLSPALREDLQAAGLTHLTAVSGANVAILAAVVVAVIAAAGGGLRLRVAGTAPAIIGFVVLARPEPSVLRAAVMGGLALIGLLLARRGAGVPMLATTAVVLLLANPWLSHSFGFVLSVLATAGLLLLVPLWLERVSRVPRPLAIALAVPVAAQLATGPVTVLLNPRPSLVAVPANLVVEAAVAPATVAGVLAAGLSPFWPAGAHAVAVVGGLATEWIALVAHRAAAVPGGSLPWPAGPFGAVLLTVATVIAVVLSLRRAWFVLTLCLLGLICCLSAPRWVAILTRDGGWPSPDWVVLQCDVGQGSATLVRSGPDRALIIDTGPDPGLVDRCLRRAGIRALDLILITHFHADHAGGIAGALHDRGAPPVVVSPFAQPSDQVRAVKAVAASAGSRVVTGATEMAGQVGTGAWAVRWRLMPPNGARPVVGRGDANGTEINNASVVMFAQVQGLRIAALGDVEPEAQRPLIREITAAGRVGGSMVPVDVAVVAHHGSARQEPQLYDLLRPRVALIGVGKDNDYGHPAPSTMTLLRHLGAVTLRTDLQGGLAVSGSSGRLRVLTAK